jgi:hypothetical protein
MKAAKCRFFNIYSEIPTMRKLFLLLIALISIESCTVKNNPAEVKILNSYDIPIIEGKLNGKKAYFLADSGASSIMLDESAAQEYGFKINLLPSSYSMQGIGGSIKLDFANNAEIKLGKLTIDHYVYCQDLSGVVSSLQKGLGYKIVGIIGSDVFRDHHAVINYENNTIVFDTTP